MLGRKRSSSSGYSHWVAAEVVGFAGLLWLLPSLPCASASYQLAAPREQPRRPGLHPPLHDRATPKQQRLRSLLAANDGASLPPGSPPQSRVYHVVDYGADPTGRNDSSDAISRAVADAFQPLSSRRTLLSGIADLGGAEVHLDGGTYLVGRPIRFPSSGGGNFKMHGGTLVASDDFPADDYLIELWVGSSSSSAGTNSGGGAFSASSSGSLDYEYVTLRDLMVDANYRGGGIAIVDSLRTTVDNCYITHFATDGILVRGGHETYIRNSFLGQHITAGADPGEKNFTGVGINLDGNDNAVTDVVIFSAATGVSVSGQANTLTGVHCYNKATGWGGVGIHLRLPGLTQARIVNCYLDYTGIVAEDPVQLLVANSFFLGDAHVVLKSVKGIMRGVTIVDNVFSGNGNEVDIVQLDESSGKAFGDVAGVIVDRNQVRGMTARATAARGSARGNGTTWAVDFAPVLLFPDRIEYVQYTLRPHGVAAALPAVVFQGHALRNVSGNRVVVESRVPMSATVHVAVDQSVVASS